MSNLYKYPIKGNWIFNLESMSDKLFCIGLDVEERKLSFPFVIADTVINDYDDLSALTFECQNLERIAKSRKVSSKEYGRIKQIVEWRVNVRYARCIASGMNEKDAGLCFSDL